MSGPELNLREVDMAMLKSMATSFRARMDFSFNADDMADLLDRVRAALPEVQAIVDAAVKAEREALEQARTTNRRFQRRMQLLEGWWQRRVDRADNAMSNYFALWLMEAKGRTADLKAIEEVAYQRGYNEGISDHTAHITKRGHILSMPAIRKRGEG